MDRRKIASLRWAEVARLYDRNTALGQENARRLMNSFYRYVGLRVRNMNDDNNPDTCNRAWHAENERKEERWLNRLEHEFAKYNLILMFYGIYPTITDKVGGSDVIYTYQY